MSQGVETDPAGFESGELPAFMGIVGSHPSMRRVYEMIRRVGPSTASVLITGESGTGKELVARALHALSPRRSRNLVPVHCGAIPEDLLESELFGHVKGAFTGAVSARTGRFRLAHGGTVFLDEIGEMSPRFQVKLLRVLEDGTFDPVGATASQTTDVRVVAATHRDLHALARSGEFREDLLYRLDVVSIHLPPLRERREDVPLIAEHFLRRLESEKGLPHCRLSEEATEALLAHDWPGNVRELRNVLERAVLLCETPGLLRAEDLPAPMARPRSGRDGAGESRAARAEGSDQPWEFGPEGANFYLELESFERRMISRALHLARGSKREAARLLNVNRTTLLEKLKRRGWKVDASSFVIPTANDGVPTPVTGPRRRPPAAFAPGGGGNLAREIAQAS